MSTAGRRLRRSARVGSGVAGAIAVVLAMSSCSPEIKGITGLMRTDHGLAGTWIACPGDDLRGALLIRDSNTDHSQHIGRWEASAPQNRAAWLLQDTTAANGWDVWKPAPSRFDPGHVYTLFAWSEENVTNAAAVDFEASDVEGLAVDEVLINDPTSESVAPITVSKDEFVKRACHG
jgi:hypothetical protein